MKKINGKVITQFIKFGIVGVSNTLVSLLVYYILIFLGTHYIIANTAGFILGHSMHIFGIISSYLRKSRQKNDPMQKQESKCLLLMVVHMY